MKSYFKVFLLVMTILSTSFVIWAGFTGRDSIFPFLLCLTLFLSISNLQFDNKKTERKLYRIAFVISSFSVILGAVNLIF
jgi:predicted acyltransferase